MRSYVSAITIILLLLLFRGATSWLHGYRFKKWWARAHAALEINDLIAAEAALRRCVKLVPMASVVHRLLGNVLARRTKLKEAEEHFRLGADLEPANPAGFVELGFFLALCLKDRAEDAVTAFSTAVTHAPDLREKLRQDPRLAGLQGLDSWRKVVSENQ